MSGSMERLPSILADRYRVLEELGRGGMGIVFRARDLKHERDVAIKVLRRELASAVEADRFHREIHIAAGLSHPHILPIYDSGEVEGLLYYVMPRIPGETLRERLHRQGRLDISEVLTLGRNLATALDHAHARNVVHRDVKPANVFLSGEEALLGDFGVAVVVDEALRENRLTSTGVAVGSPRYMSPEQLTDPDRVDWRSDVFSLGIVLFECITGHLPFEGEEGTGHPLARLARDPGDLGNDCPSPLARFVRRCLRVDSSERLPEGLGLGAAWREVEEEVARVRREEEAGAPSRSTVVAGAVLLVASTATVAVLLADRPHTGERTVLRHEPVVTWTSREEESRVVPGRGEVSFLSDRNGIWNVWAVPLEGVGERQITRESGRVHSHVWSPDGTALAYVVIAREGVTLVLSDADGGSRREIELPGQRPPRLASWTRNGVILLLDGALWSVDPVQPSLRQHSWESDIRILDADVHPDGDRVVFAGADPEGHHDLWLAALEGSDPEPLTDGAAVDRHPCWLGPTEVAFLSNRGGQMDVWSVRVPGGRPRAVTTGFTGIGDIGCASDGSVLVVDREEERADLWLWSLETGDRDPLTFHEGVELLPSASGEGQVAFQRERAAGDVRNPFIEADIVIGTLEGAELLDQRVLVENAFHPRISGDGGWVSYERRPSTAGPYLELRVSSSAGEEWLLTPRLPPAAFRVYPPMGWESEHVVWDGAAPLLFYLEGSPEPAATGAASRHLVRARMTPDGPAADTLASFAAGDEPSGLTLSPDGRRLAWIDPRETGEDHELRAMDVQNGQQVTLYRDSFADDLYAVGWSTPEGPIVLLRSFRRPAGVEEVQPLLVGLDGHTEEHPRLAGAVGGQARLDPSGTEILVPVIEGDTLQQVRRLSLFISDAPPRWEILLGGIPFSGMELLPDGRILFSRHEVDPDIWKLVFAGAG